MKVTPGVSPLVNSTAHSQVHAGLPPFVDEQIGHAVFSFGTADSGDADIGGFGEVVGGPAQESVLCAHLSAILNGLAQFRRGEFANDVEAVFRRFDR